MAGFQLRDFVSIAAAMMNHAKATQDRLTDFEIGSVARTLMEAPAIELDELYQKVFAGILDAIPTSIYKQFDFELIGKAATRGTVVVNFGGPIEQSFTIPAGTVFGTQVASVKFTSVADVVVPVGVLAATIIVVCATEGIIGNVGANAITGTENFAFPAGAVITNPAFTSGTDGQTEAERKARFVEFIRSLSRGTMESIRYAVRQARILSQAGVLTEYVSRVGTDEVPGLVEVYIYGSSGMPSPALIALAQKIVDGEEPETGAAVAGYRAAGVEVRVAPMAERSVPVRLRVTPVSDKVSKPEIRNRIATLLAVEFESVESGAFLYVEQLVEAALTVPGVLKVISANTENVACAPNEVLKLGDLHVEWANA